MADEKKTAAKATKPKAPPAPAASPSTLGTTEKKTAAKATTDAPTPRIARVRAIKTGFDHTHTRRRPDPTVFDLPVDAKTGKLPSWVVEVSEEDEAVAAAAEKAPVAGSGAAPTDASVI